MKKLVSYFILVYIGLNVAFAQIPQQPNPPKLVNDFAKVFNQNESQALESKLVRFANETSNQITVVTLKDFNGYDISDLAQRIGEKWEVGDDQFNNGLVILFKPKNAEGKGQVFIATGYGLEGAIPDITTKQIVENEMIPYFRNGDIYAGIDRGSTVIMELAKGEYNHQQYAEHVGGGSTGGGIFIFFIIVAISILSATRRRKYYGTGHRGSSLPFWLAMGLLGSNRSGGYYDNFRGGTGSFGGGSSFGGGGFGGFGGGSFGGGGAGGSW